MEPTVDPSFIRRAVELADLNAVRVALYQQTGDPELAALPIAAKLDDAGRELLVTKAVAWLLEHAGPGMPDRAARGRAAGADEHGDQGGHGRPRVRRPPRPPGVQAVPVDGDVDRRARPELPEGFQVGDHRQRLQRPRHGRAARAARHPVRPARAAAGARRHVEHQPLPRHPRRHHLDHLRVQLREELPLDASTSPAAPRCASTSTTSRRSTACFEHTRFDRDLQKATFDEDPRRVGARAAHARRRRDARGQRRRERGRHLRQPEHPALRGPGVVRGADPAPGPLARRLRRDGQARRHHRQRLHGRAAARAHRRSDAEQVHVFQRTPQWISPRDKYGKPVEPEIRWLLDNFPGYWNWWRYMAIAALFGTHGYLQPDPEWVAQGGQVNPHERQAPRRPHRLHQGADRWTGRPRRPAGPRLRPVLAGGPSSTTAGTGRSPATTSSSSPTASPGSPRRASRPPTAPSARSTPSSPPPASRS